MAPGRDYFQSLPDPLVCRIFGCIGPLHQIAPCRLVCRRWRALFEGIDCLDFDCKSLMTRNRIECTRVSLLESLIGRTIGAASCGVRELKIAGPEFGHGAVCLWLRAVAASVERLVLEEDGDEYVPVGGKLLQVFRCPALQTLTLSFYQIDRAPHGVQPLQRLSWLTLNDVAITDGALEDVVSLCPALSYLGLFDCSGLVSPYITHTTLREIALSCDELPSFTLGTRGDKDPKVEQLTVNSVNRVLVKAPCLGRLVVKSPCQIVLHRSGTLDELVLQSDERCKWKLKEVIAALSDLAKTLVHVKSISVAVSLKKIRKVVATELFGCLSNCSGLEIGVDLFECLKKAIEGELPQLPLENVNMNVLLADDKSLEVVVRLVRCCPSLRRVIVCVSAGNDETDVWKFANGLLALQRSMQQVEFRCRRVEDDKLDAEEKDTEEEEEDDDNEEEEDE